MSNSALAWAWSQKLSGMGEKCVLAALADYADDAGKCWPSIDTLAARCSGNRKSIIRIIKRLRDENLIAVTYEKSRYGRKAVYRLNQSYSATSGALSPVASWDQCQSHHATGTSPTMSFDWSHDATLTIIEPSIELSIEPSKRAKAKAKQLIGLPDWLPSKAWNGFVTARKEAKKPMTARAVELAIKQLDDLRSQGHHPAAVLDQSVMRGWSGLFPIKNQNNRPARPNGSAVAAGLSVAEALRKKENGETQ